MTQLQSDSIGARDIVLGAEVPRLLGVWRPLCTADGSQLGGLPVAGLSHRTDPTTVRRLVRTYRSIGVLRLSGLVNVVAHVAGECDGWLITDVKPMPTVAEYLQAETALSGANAWLIAVETATTLQRLHRARRSHGDVSARSVVLAISGAALLTETGLAHALGGRKPTVSDDASGWMQMVAQLAAATDDQDVGRLLMQAAERVQALGGRAGLAAALVTLNVNAHLANVVSVREPTATVALSVTTVRGDGLNDASAAAKIQNDGYWDVVPTQCGLSAARPGGARLDAWRSNSAVWSRHGRQNADRPTGNLTLSIPARSRRTWWRRSIGIASVIAALVVVAAVIQSK